jgi:phage-related protein
MSGSNPRQIPVVFYRTRGGSEVVRDWLRALDEKERNAIGLDLMRIQFRWPVQQERIVILNGFIRKTQKTPVEELALARRWKKEFEA